MTPSFNHHPVTHSQDSLSSYPDDNPRQLAGGVGRTDGEVATSDDATAVPSGAKQGHAASPANEATARLALELNQFAAVASKLRNSLVPASTFEERCRQAFDVANDLFINAPTWVCFYRELMGGNGMLHLLFSDNKSFGAFLRTDQHHQIQLMLTALRSRDLPESDPNDPQRMITVRLPKSLHEAMCEEATRLNISVNRLCISRMLQLLDPEMIPETNSKPRGRKPRTRSKNSSAIGGSPTPSPGIQDEACGGFGLVSPIGRP